MNKSFHYTYQIINLNNNKRYIGVRSCNCMPLQDVKYWGSSKTLTITMRKEGKEWFKKEILKIFTTRDEAVNHEIYLHNSLDVAVNPMFYNKSKQTSTGFDCSGICLSLEHKQKISKSNKGKTHTDESKEKMKGPRECMQGDNHPRYQMHLPKDYKQKISKSLKGRFCGDYHPMYGKTHTDESKEKMRGPRKCMQGDNNPKSMLGKKHTILTKKKISDAAKGKNNGFYGKSHSTESRQKISKSRIGRKWINKNGRNKIIEPVNINKYKKEGWSLGRYSGRSRVI